MAEAAKSASLATDLSNHLNRHVANFSVLYVKLHHFHWYVKGSSFFELHKKFQEMYEQATLDLDEIAERMLIINGQPISTMAEFLKHATIKEANRPGAQGSGQMIEELIQDFRTMSGELMETAQFAEDQHNDIGTADVLREIAANMDKNIWMLEAFIGE